MFYTVEYKTAADFPDGDIVKTAYTSRAIALLKAERLATAGTYVVSVYDSRYGHVEYFAHDLDMQQRLRGSM